jgi:hypothetical protein
MSFAEKGYEIVRGILHPQTLELIATEFQMLKDCNYFERGLQSNEYSGDPQAPNSFAWYSAFCTESLMLILKEKIEEITGKTLIPAYSFARIYYNGTILKGHDDRPSCQYSATVSIQNDGTDWPIWIDSFQGERTYVNLAPGDMLVYRGDKLLHGRDEYTGTKHLQTFLHYVDQDGEYKNHAYDQRPMLGLGKPLIPPIRL